MDLSLPEVLQIASGGIVPLGGVIIWLLWKLDKRIQALEINGQHRDEALRDIKGQLDDLASLKG